MEYIPLGDLETNVKAQSGKLVESETRDITEQILLGLQIMHAESFAHRDLKPQNILVVHGPPQWWIKIADFGLSKRLTDTTGAFTRGGSQPYMAPEVHGYVGTRKRYTNAIDIWSLGCIVYRLIAGCVPFPMIPSLGKYYADKSLFPYNPLFDSGIRSQCSDFIKELLTPEPSSRLSASTALKYQWIIQGSSSPINIIERAPTPDQLSEALSALRFDTASHAGLQSDRFSTDPNPFDVSPSRSPVGPSLMTTESITERSPRPYHQSSMQGPQGNMDNKTLRPTLKQSNYRRATVESDNESEPQTHSEDYEHDNPINITSKENSHSTLASRLGENVHDEPIGSAGRENSEKAPHYAPAPDTNSSQYPNPEKSASQAALERPGEDLDRIRQDALETLELLERIRQGKEGADLRKRNNKLGDKERRAQVAEKMRHRPAYVEDDTEISGRLRRRGEQFEKPFAQNQMVANKAGATKRPFIKEAPLEPKWALHRDFAGEYMQATRRPKASLETSPPESPFDYEIKMPDRKSEKDKARPLLSDSVRYIDDDDLLRRPSPYSNLGRSSNALSSSKKIKMPDRKSEKEKARPLLSDSVRYIDDDDLLRRQSPYSNSGRSSNALSSSKNEKKARVHPRDPYICIVEPPSPRLAPTKPPPQTYSPAPPVFTRTGLKENRNQSYLDGSCYEPYSATSDTHVEEEDLNRRSSRESRSQDPVSRHVMPEAYATGVVDAAKEEEAARRAHQIREAPMDPKWSDHRGSIGVYLAALQKANLDRERINARERVDDYRPYG